MHWTRLLQASESGPKSWRGARPPHPAQRAHIHVHIESLSTTSVLCTTSGSQRCISTQGKNGVQGGPLTGGHDVQSYRAYTMTIHRDTSTGLLTDGHGLDPDSASVGVEGPNRGVEPVAHIPPGMGTSMYTSSRCTKRRGHFTTASVVDPNVLAHRVVGTTQKHWTHRH